MSSNAESRWLEWSRTTLANREIIGTTKTRDGFTTTLVGKTIYLLHLGVLYGLDTTQKSWLRIPHRGDLPGARMLYSQVLYNDKLLVYGGKRPHGPGATFEASHHIFDFCTETWIKEDERLVSPGACFGHTADFIRVTNEVVLFGGSNDAGYSNKLYVLNVERMKWTLLYVCGEAPSPRYRHSSSVWGSVLFVFAGKARKRIPFNDLYAVDMALSQPRWTRIDCQFSPTPRFDAKMEAFSGCLLLFGGIAVGRKTVKLEDDLHLFDIRRRLWTKVGFVHQESGGRFAMTSSLVPGVGFYSSMNAGTRLGLIGTADSGQGFGELYELEFR